jgi:hypothetical protein
MTGINQSKRMGTPLQVHFHNTENYTPITLQAIHNTPANAAYCMTFGRNSRASVAANHMLEGRWSHLQAEALGSLQRCSQQGPHILQVTYAASRQQLLNHFL